MASNQSKLLGKACTLVLINWGNLWFVLWLFKVSTNCKLPICTEIFIILAFEKAVAPTKLSNLNLPVFFM